MRVLANYSKKVCTGQYENEVYTVTVECDVDMNIERVGETADTLFAEAKSAVQRQIESRTVTTTPATVIPISKTTQEKEPQTTSAPKPVYGKNTPLPATEKQVGMIKKLLAQNFKDSNIAKRWLLETFGVDATASMSRKVASKAIDGLMDLSRKTA